MRNLVSPCYGSDISYVRSHRTLRGTWILAWRFRPHHGATHGEFQALQDKILSYLRDKKMRWLGFTRYTTRGENSARSSSYWLPSPDLMAAGEAVGARGASWGRTLGSRPH